MRILDLSIWVQGPLAAMMLADLGADVIKIEMPGIGDFARGAKSIFGRSQELSDGRMLMFEIANRNKRGISIDLRHPAGREAFYKLVLKSDALVTNLHPSALAEFRVDRKTLTEINPDLIYAHATGYGPAGPAALDPCQDTTGMARSGFMFNAPAKDGSPIYQIGTLSDVLSGTMLAFAVVTAFLNRERWGHTLGAVCSQLSAMMWLQYYCIAQYANTGNTFIPHDRANAANPLVNIYRCSDGKWIACGMFLSQRFVWKEFCELMRIPEAGMNPCYQDDAGRNQHNRELISLLDAAFARRPRSEWENAFRAKGYWSSVINDLPDLTSDPQVLANDYLSSSESGLKTVSYPFSLQGTVLPKPKDAPTFGRDTDAVLEELAGYTKEQILQLKTEGAVW